MSIFRGGRCRSFLSLSLFCVLASLVFTARLAAATYVWQRWDQQLQVGFDYLNGGGNPYQDLNLAVQFNGPQARSFTGYGFWDGGNVFRVRAAFPAIGTWSWRVTSCSGLNGKNPQGQIQPCGSDTTLTANSGQVTVAANNNPNNLLYSNGFLKTAGRYLTFTDNPTRRFYWQGDTAWAAIALEGQKRLAQSTRVPGQVTTTWKSYVDDRSSRNFTVLQVGAAIAWQPKAREPLKSGCPAPTKSVEWGDASAVVYPGPETFAFEQLPALPNKPCVGAVPNNCSRWRADYWQEVDSMVEYANEQGLVVMMAGVADPSDRGGCHVSQSYPRTADSVIFARNLAARLAGNHVIFSVNFDDWPGAQLDASAPTAGTVKDTTLAVGPALKSVVPRHLIVNHIAGSAQVSDYTAYQGLPWLDFQLLQSGHASNVSVACPGKSGTTWQAQQQCAVSRAIDLTKGLRAASPLKPAVNGEGAYEDPDPMASPPDNRYGMRHTAYASLLAGAAGFTAGVDGKYPNPSLARWDQPEALFGPQNTTGGIQDVQVTRTRFEKIFPAGTAGWGEFSSTTAALVEVTTPPKSGDPPPGERRILTGTKDDVLLSYVPNNPLVNVIGSLRFRCDAWTAEWWDVKRVQADPIKICPKGTQTQFRLPFGCPNRLQGDQFGACDWLMFMRRPKSAGNGLVAVGTGDSYLQVTIQISTEQASPVNTPNDQLVAQVVAGDGTPISPPTSVGLDGSSQYGQPTVVSDGQQGSYWVVWEAETTGNDGTTDIFARLVGQDGNPVGEAFQVNQWMPGSQFDPFTVIDTAGNVTVIWTSMGQDGDQGGIFARRFQLSGSPAGDELQVNVASAGDQESAKAGVDSSGNVVIAWQSNDGEIRARMYSVTGAPLTREIVVNSMVQGREELVELDVAPAGGFVAHWEAYSSDDQLLGRYVRGFDAAGNPLGTETMETIQ